MPRFLSLILAWFSLAVTTASAEATGSRNDRNPGVEDRLREIQRQIDVLASARERGWLTAARVEEVRTLARDVLADADTRASLQGAAAVVGYDRGAFIRSADNRFLLRLRGQLQLRWMFDHRSRMPGQQQGKSDIYGFEIRRMKLHFRGHVVDPSLRYQLTIATNVGALAGRVPVGHVFLENAWIEKNFENGLHFRIGQYKGPYLREEMVSSAALLAVERSMVNNAFTYQWNQGLEVGWSGDDVSFRVMYNNGPREFNRRFSRSQTNSVIARGEWVLAGSRSQFRSLNSFGMDTFGLMLGGAMQWFETDLSERSLVNGNILAQDSVGFTVDISMFDEGWTLFSYFVLARGRNEAPVFERSTLTSWGWVGQGGITIMKDLQLFARYEVGDIQDYRGSLDLPGETGHLSTLTLGFNLWPAGVDDVKFTCDFGYSFSTLAAGAGANDSPLNRSRNPGFAQWPGRGNGWQPDYGNQDGQWLLRAQFQILF